MDATRYATFGIEGDIVLHRPQVGQAEVNLLRTLPVFLEPSAGIAVHGQVEHQHAGDIRAFCPQRLLELKRHVQLPLLALRLVLCLGSLLGGTPPLLIFAIPFNGRGKPFGKVGMLRLPAQLTTQLRGVNGVAAVVAGTVAHPIEIVGGLAHALEDGVQNVDIVLFAVGADEVRLAVAPPRQDSPYGGRVILGVDPVAHVQAVAIQLWLDAAQDVGDLAGNELLHMLEGAVVV